MDEGDLEDMVHSDIQEVFNKVERACQGRKEATVGKHCGGSTAVLGKSQWRIKWSVVAEGPSLGISLTCAVLVNGLFHGWEMEANEPPDDLI